MINAQVHSHSGSTDVYRLASAGFSSENWQLTLVHGDIQVDWLHLVRNTIHHNFRTTRSQATWTWSHDWVLKLLVFPRSGAKNSTHSPWYFNCSNERLTHVPLCKGHTVKPR